MTQKFISQEQFNIVLRIGILISILLITIGGIIFLAHHFMQNYDAEIIQPRLHLHRFWMPVIKAGIFLIIVLQIARTLYYSTVFLIEKDIWPGLMAAFISAVLIFSLLFSVI